MTSNEKPHAVVRPAREADAPGIANVHLNSWREAYHGLMPQSYLDSLPLSFQKRMEWWKKCIASPERGHKIWVAESEKHGIVGFAAIEEPRDAEFSTSGELTCIYLLRAYHGSGIGHQLLRSALAAITVHGFKSAYCWALKGSPAIDFYKKTGAKILDRHKTEKIGSFEITEVVCYWEILK